MNIYLSTGNAPPIIDDTAKFVELVYVLVMLTVNGASIFVHIPMTTENK